MLEIQELINQCKGGRQLEILIRLKTLNKQAFLHMRQFGKSYKQKYREMWKTEFWKEGKELLREYFKLENSGKLYCYECKKEIKGKGILHHIDFYNNLNLFTPLYVGFLCSNKCHSKIHEK